MKKFNLFLLMIVIAIISCNSYHYDKKSKEIDSRKIELINNLEEDLLNLKNITLIDYLGELESISFRKYHILTNDSCFKKNNIVDASNNQYTNKINLNLMYVFQDKNRKELINRWIEKDFDLTPIEVSDKIMYNTDLYKGLEFYNSVDLRNYIDSVRKIEIKIINDQH